MKCLFLAPLHYPFIQAIHQGFEAHGIEVRAVDFVEFFKPRTNKWMRKITPLPKKVRNYWENPYAEKVNAGYQRVFEEVQPDIVFIYNNQLVHPDTLARWKNQAKITFMLGDNPLYTPTSLYNLHILYQADYIISPDTLWRDQLLRMGVPNVVFDCFGFNESTYYPMEVSAADRAKYGSDFIYIGRSHKTNWGYKRFLYLSLFKDFDLKAYISGGGYQRWTRFFPGLEQRIVDHNRYDAGFNNLAYNCSKIAPVEQVPSLFNGIHVRVFDILGANILPLCEYSPDLEMVFEGIDIPMIRDYQKGAEVAAYWLAHDAERKAVVEQMRERVLERYLPKLTISRLLQAIGLPSDIPKTESTHA